MKCVIRHVIFAALLSLALAGPASAQYIYLDTNGDGINTAADRLNENGTPTVVDAWIDTNHNKGGALATCDTGDGDLGFWNSYAMSIAVSNGTATFTNFTNRKTTWTLACVAVGVNFLSDNTEMTACVATSTSEAGGLQRMFTVTVTGQSGTPSLDYTPVGHLAPQYFTSFGTPCSGNDFDNTYKLGSDFFDNDGAGPAGGVTNGPPQINAPATVNGAENALVTVTGSASDPDAADMVTLSQTNNAPFLTGPSSSGPSTSPAITLTGTPDFSQSGTYQVNWTAVDNFTVPNTSTATTNVVIANTDRAPTVTAPPTVSGNEAALMTFTVTASDPDGDAITALNGAPLPGGSTFTPNAARTSGTFSWTPTYTQSGSYLVTWTASTFGLSGTAQTNITVVNVDRPPVVVAPATASGDEATLITFTVSAADPDAQTITSLTAASSPATTGSTFAANGTNTSGTFSWTPSLTQSGTYTVTFTASNALSGTAATTITVNDVAADRSPIVTAPATASGDENTLITFTVSANDPDGDAITSLTAASSPATTGSTFTADGTNTSGTFSWTPTFTQSGTFNVTFTASNALSGTAATTVTVNNVDRAPTVTAPATASGDENTTITVTVTANDPDGDAIASLTAASSPATTGSTFATNGAHTSGTFSWIPTFTQAGTYTVTFTAANALSGTAATTVTVNNVDRAPTVTAPPSASGNEGTLITFTVSASDPDGEAITSLTAASAPATTGSTFTPNGTNTSGTFSWTPSFTQAGAYNVTFTASNALSGTAVTTVTVNPVDRAPVVTAPATASGATNELITIVATASDPDGDPIASLTASSSPATTGSTFTPNGANTSGTFSWTPSNAQAGTYTITFTASNALSGTAATTLEVTSGDRRPVVTAPATASGDENTLITFTVSATDPDGEAITSLTAASSPATTGSTFTADGTNTSGTFSWTPSFTQAGTYTVTFTASNALSGTAATAVTVNDVDRAPIVTAPPTASGNEGTLISFAVSASDPDGDAIASLTAAPLPTGAGFISNAAHTSGTFDWTPGFDQAGTHIVTFTASNALSGTASTEITVNDVDRAPTVAAPPTASGDEGTLITFVVTAADPDGDAITSLTAAGSAITAGGTFAANASNTSGTFEWTPTAGQAGPYSVTFTASNALSGTASTAITVTRPNQAPIVTSPPTVSGIENSLITFGVSATDPDGDHVTLTALNMPTGAVFNDNGDGTGTFSWTPTFTQAGSYTVTFRGNDGNGGIGDSPTTITVENLDRAPVADAGGPYTGVVNVAVSFNGSGSSDPDGDALTYAWDFGDGGTSNDVNPSHTYTTSGVFNVTLTVSSGTPELSDTDATTATISDTFAANAFTVGGNKTTSLGSGKPYTCVQIEPVGGSYQNSDVMLATIRMSYPVGSSNTIAADASKTSIDGDKNGDGTSEIAACFRKTDLRTLFSGLPSGRNTVTVEITGDLIGGGNFSATLTMIVKSTGGFLSASVTPNPLNPQAVLTFATTKPGAIRVQMFDPQGRLVKTVADEASSNAGYHDFTIDGRSASGAKLASGVYFVRIWAEHDGAAVQRVTIMK